jgi:hypothetical protein
MNGEKLLIDYRVLWGETHMLFFCLWQLQLCLNTRWLQKRLELLFFDVFYFMFLAGL